MHEFEKPHRSKRSTLKNTLNHLKLTITGIAILFLFLIIPWGFKTLGISNSILFFSSSSSSSSSSSETHILNQLEQDTPTQTGINKSSFKLKHAFRHGVGKFNDIHQMHTFQDEKLYGTQETMVRLNHEDDSEYEDRLKIYTQFTEMYPEHKISLNAETINLHRMSNRDPDFVIPYLDYSLENPELSAMIEIEWNFNEPVLSPNVTDKDTVLGLAFMASNAYVRSPQDSDWRNVSDPWKSHMGHGWDGDGVRGHVFTNEDESLIVIALKGTSSNGLPGGNGETETIENDKINDNLLFSCCCARVSYLWTTVCDCYEKSYTCNQRCLEKELRRKDRYFEATLDIYKNVTNLYPHADIWVTGHSLGGPLASFLGRSFGLPTVTFEAPGELLPTKRLHLPMPPGIPDYMEGVYHFGHTADPIFVGTCNGASSSCGIAGYAMETSCHSGKVCMYDVVKDHGWHVNMLNHRIHTVIDEVLMKYDEVAKCVKPEPCIDCYNWRYTLGDQPDPQPAPEPEPEPVPEPNPPHTTPPHTTPPSSTNQKYSFSSTTTKTKKQKTSSSTTSTTCTEIVSSTCVGRNFIGWCTSYEPIQTV